jgi:hypothetical protein
MRCDAVACAPFRRLLKLLKGHAAALLTHRDAYLAVLALCECTDDTVALQKGLLAELCVAPTAEELLAEKTLAANPYADDEGEGDEEGEEDGEGEGDGEEEDEGEEDGEDGEDEADGEDGEDEEGNDEENAMREDDDEDEEKEGGDDAKASPKKARTALKGVAASAASTEVERAAPLLAVALSPNGAKLLLRVLSAGDPKHLDPLEVELLALPAEASKKDPQVNEIARTLNFKKKLCTCAFLNTHLASLKSTLALPPFAYFTPFGAIPIPPNYHIRCAGTSSWRFWPTQSSPCSRSTPPSCCSPAAAAPSPLPPCSAWPGPGQA